MGLMNDFNGSSFNIEVEYTDNFKDDVRILKKRYPHIRSDIECHIKDLQNGIFNGDPIPGACSDTYKIYKLRVKNSDINKGKSKGYRFIYFAATISSDASPIKVILISIYSKALKQNISVNEIKSILSEHLIAIEFK